MHEWTEFARGPLFRLCFIIMVLGFLRHILMAAWGIIQMVHRARDRHNSYGQMLKTVATWLLPVQRLHRHLPWTSYSSFLFHVGLILVPLFLVEHIQLWKAGLGFSWPGFPKLLADGLTITALVSGTVLLGLRIFTRRTREVSGFMDYFLLVLLLFILMSGFLSSRSYNPVPYEIMMLLHVLAGDLAMFLAPFSKIVHCVLYPFVRLTSELAWKFPPDAGRNITIQVHGEVKSI